MTNDIGIKVAVQGVAQVQADLRQVAQATQGVASTMNTVGQALGNYTQMTRDARVEANLLRQANRQLAMQMTDVVTSLASGMPAWMVFIQQGGQIKDAYGGIGNAIRGVGGFLRTLISPLSLAAAGFATLGTAAFLGAREMDAYVKALTLSGNAAGTTAGALDQMAQRIGAVAGTQGRAAEVLAGLAANGDIAASSLESVTLAAIELERAGGPAAEETAKRFAALGDKPLAAALKLNEQTRFLTLSVYEQIKALESQGRTAEATAVATNAALAKTQESTKTLEGRLGLLEKSWRLVGDAAKGAWDFMLGLGRATQTSPEEQLANVQATLARRTANQATALPGNQAAYQPAIDALRLQESLLQEQLRLQARALGLSREQQAVVQARAEWDKEANKYLTEQQRLAKAIAEAREQGLAAKVGEAAIEQRIAAIRASFAKGGAAEIDREAKATAEAVKVREKYLETLTASAAKMAQENQALADQVKQVLMGKDAYQALIDLREEEQAVLLETQAIRALDRNLDQKEFEALKGQAAAIRERIALRRALTQANAEAIDKAIMAGRTGLVDQDAAEIADTKRLKSAQDIVAAIGRETAALSMSNVEREVSVALLELERLGIEKGTYAYDVYASKIREAIVNRDTVRRSIQQTEEIQREWQRTADQIGQSLTDALMQGGKSAWEYIKSLFRTMVLRPIIQAVVNPVAGMFAGATPGASGALGTLGGINSLATLGSTITGSVAGSIGNVIGTAGTLFGSSALTSFAAGMKGATLAPGLMGPTTVGASGAMGAGASVAAAIPYVAAALAVANALGVFRSKSIVGGGLTGTLGAGDIQSYDLQRRGGTLFSGPDYSMVNRQTSTESAAIQSAFKALRTNAASMAEALGLSSTAVKSFTTVLGTDITQNDIGTRGIKLDGLTPEQAAKKVEEALAAANEELAAFVLGASRTVTESITTTVEDWAEGENDRYLRGYLNQVSEVTRTIEATGPSFARTGETAVQTLTRLASSISTINPVLDLLGLQLFDTSLAGADLASTMADAFGGLQAFTAATSTYYQEFFSEAERTAAVTAQLTETLGGLGMALPDTREAFRDLVEAQDLSTESGRKAAATLIQLSGAFASITQEVTTLTNSFARDAVQTVATSLRSMRSDVAEANQRVLQARQNVFDSYSSSLERLRGLLRQSAASTAAFGQSIQELLNDLRFSADLSPYSPSERFALLQQTYGSTLSAARSGDAAAMEQLPDIARQFVAAAQDLSQTEVEYATYVAGIQQDLANIMAEANARQAALMAQMPSAAVAPDATLAQEIAAAVADLGAWAAAVATTGGMASLANNQTATAIEAFNAAVEEQTAATGSLNAALAALTSLGLSQSSIDALSAGISSGASAYADALGVSEDTISQLQDALGINDEALDAAAAALKVQLEAETVTRLATALGLPEATVRELATSLGVDAPTLEKISTALGLSSQQAAELNTILGLSPAERISLANALGINSAATTALATAVGVSPAALSALQAAVGLSQASTATIAGLSSIIDFSPAALAQINRLAAIRLQIDEDIVQQLATSLGLPADTVRQLATALGVSVGTLSYLSTALGLSSQQAAELQTILGLSATERASLANALGINSAATTALATAVGVSPAALSALQAAVGLSQASAATIASLPSIIDFSPAALAQINRLAGALGLQPAVLQSLAQAVALKPEVLPALAASLGLSDAQLSDLALSLGYSATTADALAESLGLGAGLTQELSQALGLSPAAIETIRVLSGALSGIPSTIRVESAPVSLVTPGVRSSIRDIAATGTQDEKAALYRMLRLIGLDDAVIRSTVDAEVGPQTDDAWALLKRVAGFAAGGMHQGGWRVVGEAGPELAYTGPERIFSNAQSRSLMDTSRLEAQMAALQAELALLRAETRATAVNTAKTADLIERATDGGSDYVRVVVDETIS